MNYDRRLKIRKQYKLFHDEIMSGKGFDPYAICHEWMHAFTPIENNVWSEIRFLGLRMYPQFPVINYFLDFADPIKKIGIEVDGKEWHLDKEKDLIRQRELEAIGWRIIRIAGKDTYECRQELEDECAWEDERQPDNVYCECATCQLKHLKELYGNPT